MTPFRTKACGLALQIWSKTCKAFVRSIRKQLAEGVVAVKVPNTLFVLSSFLEKMKEEHSPKKTRRISPRTRQDMGLDVSNGS